MTARIQGGQDVPKDWERTIRVVEIFSCPKGLLRATTGQILVGLALINPQHSEAMEFAGISMRVAVFASDAPTHTSAISVSKVTLQTSALRPRTQLEIAPISCHWEIELPRPTDSQGTHGCLGHCSVYPKDSLTRCTIYWTWICTIKDR